MGCGGSKPEEGGDDGTIKTQDIDMKPDNTKQKRKSMTQRRAAVRYATMLPCQVFARIPRRLVTVDFSLTVFCSPPHCVLSPSLRNARRPRSSLLDWADAMTLTSLPVAVAAAAAAVATVAAVAAATTRAALATRSSLLPSPLQCGDE